MSDNAEIFIDCACELGEGPFWHPGRQELFWFDIMMKRLHAAKLDGTPCGEWAFDRYSSAAGIIDDDRLLIASAGALTEYSLANGVIGVRAELEPDLSNNRSNDGRVHPSGTFWIGTMGVKAAPGAGSLYTYRNGKLDRVLGNITVTNATCFSPDGRTAYFSDTPTSIILKIEVDSETGLPIGEWQVFADFSGDGFHPDGAVVDSEGFVWNAQWGAGRAVRLSPDGRIDRIVTVAASNVTCPVFCGPDLKTLCFTSARAGLTPEQLVEQPSAGGLFRIEVDVPGQAESIVAL